MSGTRKDEFASMRSTGPYSRAVDAFEEPKLPLQAPLDHDKYAWLCEALPEFGEGTHFPLKSGGATLFLTCHPSHYQPFREKAALKMMGDMVEGAPAVQLGLQASNGELVGLTFFVQHASHRLPLLQLLDGHIVRCHFLVGKKEKLYYGHSFDLRLAEAARQELGDLLKTQCNLLQMIFDDPVNFMATDYIRAGYYDDEDADGFDIAAGNMVTKARRQAIKKNRGNGRRKKA